MFKKKNVKNSFNNREGNNLKKCASNLKWSLMTETMLTTTASGKQTLPTFLKKQTTP